MASPKLFTALNILTKDEWSSFRVYLLSKARRNSDIFHCYEILFKKKNQLLKGGIDDQIREKHFPQMSEKVFSNLLSRLFKWFEDWFALHLISSEKFAAELALMRGYNQRGLFKLATQVYKRIDKDLNKVSEFDPEIAKARSEVLHNMYFSNNPLKKEPQIFDNSIQSFLLHTKEKAYSYLLEIENKSRIKKRETEIEKELLGSLISMPQVSALTKVFQTNLQIFRDDDLSALKNLKETLSGDSIDKRSDLFLVLSYYLRINTIRLFHQGLIPDKDFFLDVFYLNLEAINKNPNQVLTQFQLINAIDGIGGIVELKQTEAIIKKYVPKAKTENPDSLFALCTALNLFKHDSYEQIPVILRAIEYDHYELQLMGQAILIISLYMNQEDNQAMNSLENFKKQLKRNKSRIHVVPHLSFVNLCNIIGLLLKRRFNKDIQIDVSQFERIFFKSWVDKQLGAG